MQTQMCALDDELLTYPYITFCILNMCTLILCVVYLAANGQYQVYVCYWATRAGCQGSTIKKNNNGPGQTYCANPLYSPPRPPPAIGH